MTAVTTDRVSRIAGLSDSAFAAFCEDIGGMFGVEMRCDRREMHTTTAGNLRTQFQKLAAVHLVQADGHLNGIFHLVFDQGALFILAGVVVMLPESSILASVKQGTMETATNLQDAVREVGNLLVGSWDRVFRENCSGHGHFVKTSTFLGKPWNKPEQIELQSDAEVLAILYEMSIEPYPSFTCAAVFPAAVLEALAETEPTARRDPCEGTGRSNSAGGSETRPQPVVSAKPTAGAAGGSQPAKQPEVGAVAVVADPCTGSHSVQKQDSAPAKGDAVPRAAACVAAPAEDGSSASQTLDKGNWIITPECRNPSTAADILLSKLALARSGVSGSGGLAFLDEAHVRSHPQVGLAELLSGPVADVMEKEVVWAAPEDTVQDVIARMQQHDAGYVLVGSDRKLEGLVSSSSIQGAVSVYLRPVFAKWRTAQDDATLRIKVKWIMSRLVRTVRPDTTVAAAIESMCRCGGRCLPVVDAKGDVQGIVTVFDILLRVLGSDRNVAWKGRPPQAPSVLI